MSEKKSERSNVLLFRPVPKRTSSKTQTAELHSELRELLAVYDQLIGLLRETDSESLDILTDSLVMLVVRGREALKTKADDRTVLELVKEMRSELRQTPKTLRSLLPGIGPRLGESLQYKLGIEFSKY
jgi:transposase